MDHVVRGRYGSCSARTLWKIGYREIKVNRRTFSQMLPSWSSVNNT